MIELIAAAVTGAVVGGGFGWTHAMLWQGISKQWKSLQYETGDRWGETLAALDKALTNLTALRSNCFIPDERGVKVRYSEASMERRVKAETPRTDKV